MDHPMHLSESDIARRTAERAGNVLRHDDAAARAGLLDLPVVQLQHDAGALLRVAQTAYAAWQIAEVASEQLRADDFIGAGFDLVGTTALETIYQAQLDASVAAASDLTDRDDEFAEDRLSLCGALSVLNDLDRRLRFSTIDWARTLGYPEVSIADVVVSNTSRLHRLRDLVPERWPSQEHANRDLGLLRAKAIEERNRDRSFSDIYGAENAADRGRFVSLVLELSIDLSTLVKGPTLDLGSFKAFARRDAERFWATCFSGPRNEWSRHLAQRSPPDRTTP